MRFSYAFIDRCFATRYGREVSSTWPFLRSRCLSMTIGITRCCFSQEMITYSAEIVSSFGIKISRTHTDIFIDVIVRVTFFASGRKAKVQWNKIDVDKCFFLFFVFEIFVFNAVLFNSTCNVKLMKEKCLDYNWKDEFLSLSLLHSNARHTQSKALIPNRLHVAERQARTYQRGFSRVEKSIQQRVRTKSWQGGRNEWKSD